MRIYAVNKGLRFDSTWFCGGEHEIRLYRPGSSWAASMSRLKKKFTKITSTCKFVRQESPPFPPPARHKFEIFARLRRVQRARADAVHTPMAAVRHPPASPSSSAALHRRPPLPRPVFGLPRSLFFFPSPLGKARIRCSSQRQALFNRIAPIYDDLNDLLSLGLHRSWKRMCISWSGAKKGDRALDLCCGSGDLTFLLSQKVGLQGEVCGLDFSREQLSIASVRQDLYWKASYQNIQWIEGDALDLPFSDCYFDAITMGYGLRNLVDRQKALSEIFRVLKPGSKVSILDFNKSTSSLVSMVQEWMLDNVVVPVASNYGFSQEYKYLKGSIAEFLTGKELEKLVDEIGFSKARHYEIGGGFMGNLVATK